MLSRILDEETKGERIAETYLVKENIFCGGSEEQRRKRREIYFLAEEKKNGIGKGGKNWRRKHMFTEEKKNRE